MRTKALRSYLDTNISMLETRSVEDPRLRLFLSALRGTGDAEITRCYSDADWPGKRDFHNDLVLRRALGNIPDGNQMGVALREILHHLDWSLVFHGPEAPEALSAFMHVAALTFRPHTPEAPGVHAGIFVLHPDLDYPLHTHLADEVYVCLSGGLTIKHGVAGHTQNLMPGDYSITPSERLHSLHTGVEPVILSYVWHGDLGAPNWWWDADDAGHWTRERWQWEEDHEWRSYGSEPVTDEIMARCNP